MAIGIQVTPTARVSVSVEQRLSLEILAMSQVELKDKIHEMLQTNCLLEEGLPDNNTESSSDQELSSDQFDNKSGRDTSIRDDPRDREYDIDDYRLPALSQPQASSESLEFADPDTHQPSLQSWLIRQLSLLGLGTRDQNIAVAIVESIDEDGRLEDNLEDVYARHSQTIDSDFHNFETVLKLIQRIEPGIGGRDWRETLLLQLADLDTTATDVQIARAMIEDHVDLLTKGKFNHIAKFLGLKEGDLQGARTILKSLDPKPGQRFSAEATQYVTPDVMVEWKDDRWVVSLNSENEHRLIISPHKQQYLSNDSDPEARQFAQAHLKEANWFLQSLSQRNATLLEVASEIVKHQAPFMTHGPSALQPQQMSDIADAIERDPSTVSRAVKGKLIQTPKGLCRMRLFFTSTVATDSGGTITANAVQAQIKLLIDQESPDNPLSDQKIADILKARKIDVKRRTVAKYREQLGLLTSSQRRSL